MYPPTVGDVLQTLESDPEERFTTLIKALRSTGLDNEIQDYSSKWNDATKINLEEKRVIKEIGLGLKFHYLPIFTAGPWTVFAPTNKAFRNIPMQELEDLVEDKAKLSRLLLNHLVNRSLYSAGLRSHQKIEMANGRHVNVFARKSKIRISTKWV